MSLDNILLGLLQHPASGYDLKATFDNAIRYFWAAELSQIYPTLQRLEREGLLTSRIESSSKGPDRRVYSLTAAGREQLLGWLADEPKLGGERFAYLAQVYFLGAARDVSRTLWFVSDLRRTFIERLRTFRQIEQEWKTGPAAEGKKAPDEHFHKYLALRAGILAMEARVRWCDETIERIDLRTAGNRVIRKRKSERKKP